MKLEEFQQTISINFNHGVQDGARLMGLKILRFLTNHNAPSLTLEVVQKLAEEIKEEISH